MKTFSRQGRYFRHILALGTPPPPFPRPEAGRAEPIWLPAEPLSRNRIMTETAIRRLPVTVDEKVRS